MRYPYKTIEEIARERIQEGFRLGIVAPDFLSNLQLTTLPAEIGRLSNLTTLNLSNNQLARLPGEVWQLIDLTTLDLSNNQFTTLPTRIGQLTNLTTLILSNNQISSLPAEIGQLTNLTTLVLSDNQISTLPAEIGKLTDLTMLNLSKNRLTTLPAEIGRLANLISLDLNNNSLTALPEEIQSLTRLSLLALNNNSIYIPPEILKKQNEPNIIFNNYFAHSKKALNESKVLVVGQGSVGKTSIVSRLIQNIFDANERKTEGITIHQWNVKSDKSVKNQLSKIQLNIWDFGGQEIMHATHQFFLTKRSLYLLVLDSRLTQEENRVEYWLKIIQSFGGESPVLIVGNKNDQHPLDVDRTGLHKKYPSIVGIVETSAATGAGIEELKSAIAEQVSNLPHIRDLLPESWFIAKTLLERLGRKCNFITHDEYLAFCDENGIYGKINQHTLIGFMHDLGVVLHFQDDPRLEALGILNPQWVTNGVYKILNSRPLFDNKGVLERTMLDEILDLPEYPANKRLFIVDMMRKFELCYDIEPDKTFLVPDLLPKDEPYTGEWQNALAFQYHYNVLPSSIISRFIVRVNVYIHKTVWRSGVVLKKAGNMALVKADIEDRKIYIWVNGEQPTRRDLLSVIRAEFEAIHKTIIKIETTEKVPVPGHSEVEPIPFEFLSQAEREGRTTIPVMAGGKLIDVNVRELLSGVSAEFDRRSQSELLLSTPKPVKSAVASSKNRSLILSVLTAIFATVPRVIGRTILDLFGRDKALDSTAILLGYVLIVLVVMLVWGILDVNSLVNWFVGWWRFFNPVK